MPVQNETISSRPLPPDAPLEILELPDEAIVCPCLRVTKGDVTTAIRDGHASVKTLAHATRAGTAPGCTVCQAPPGELIAACKPQGPSDNPTAEKKLNKVESDEAGEGRPRLR